MPSAPLVVEPSAAPWRLQLLLIKGGGAPDVHMSLVAGESHSPAPATVGARVSTPERMGESAATAEAAARVEQCPRWRARDALSPSRVRSAQPLTRPRQTAR
jgi:hypothetical protein